MCVKLIKRWEYGYNTRCRPEGRGICSICIQSSEKMTLPFSVSQKTRERILEAAGELGYNKCFEYSAIQGTRGTIGVMLCMARKKKWKINFIRLSA